jgi:hypothetical protein
MQEAASGLFVLDFAAVPDELTFYTPCHLTQPLPSTLLEPLVPAVAAALPVTCCHRLNTDLSTPGRAFALAATAL